MHPHWLLPAIFRRIDLAGALGGTRTSNLLIRSSMSGHPYPFMSVTSVASLPVVHARSESQKVVRPGGSQRGSQRHAPRSQPGYQQSQVDRCFHGQAAGRTACRLTWDLAVTVNMFGAGCG